MTYRDHDDAPNEQWEYTTPPEVYATDEDEAPECPQRWGA